MGYPGRRPPSGESDWLTLGQAAKFLGVAQSTIRKWSDQGRVPAFYTPGGHRRYRRGDLETFLDRVSSVEPTSDWSWRKTPVFWANGPVDLSLTLTGTRELA